MILAHIERTAFKYVHLVMFLYMHRNIDYTCILTGILTKILKLKCKCNAKFEVYILKKIVLVTYLEKLSLIWQENICVNIYFFGQFFFHSYS